MDLQIAYNPTTKVAMIQLEGASVPGGSTAIGTFEHSFIEDFLGGSESHVLYQHVRDAFYEIDEQNMQKVSIVIDPAIELIYLESISVTPVTASIAVAGTSQLTPAFVPTDATVKTVVYVSSNPAVATVNGTGLVTGVSAGTATITVTSNDGGHTATSGITVS